MQRTAARQAKEINASSMADIAFLLLIFFLVTTTMNMDRGLLTLLPSYTNEATIDHREYERNILEILVNSSDQLLVEGELTNIRELKKITMLHVGNYGEDPKFSDHPQDAIVSLKNDRGTSYETYIQVHNEIRAAYNELRNEYSEQKFGLGYKELGKEEQKKVRQEYPLKLSEAEPVGLDEW